MRFAPTVTCDLIPLAVCHSLWLSALAAAVSAVTCDLIPLAVCHNDVDIDVIVAVAMSHVTSYRLRFAINKGFSLAPFLFWVTCDLIPLAVCHISSEMISSVVEDASHVTSYRLRFAIGASRTLAGQYVCGHM